MKDRACLECGILLDPRRKKYCSRVCRERFEESGHYAAVHIWLRRRHPYARRCEWCGCANNATQYAYGRGASEAYSRNRAEWFEFCIPCHRRFDGKRTHTPESRERMAAVKRGKTKSAETKAKISASQRASWAARRDNFQNGWPELANSPDMRAGLAAGQHDCQQIWGAP